MRHIAILLLLLAIIPSAAAQGEVLATRMHNLELAAFRHSVRMDAATHIARERSLNYTELERIRAQFDSQRASLSSTRDLATLHTKEDVLLNVAKDFKDASKAAGLRAYADEVAARAAELENERGNETDTFTERAIEARTIAMLRLFDHHIALTEDAINRSKERNISMNETEAALAEFIALKQELVAAMRSGEKARISSLRERLRERWLAVRESYARAHLSGSIELAITKGELVAKRIDSNSRLLRRSGVSTGAIERRLIDLRAYLAKARASAASGDALDALDALGDAKAKLEDLVVTYEQTRTGTLAKAAGGEP